MGNKQQSEALYCLPVGLSFSKRKKEKKNGKWTDLQTCPEVYVSMSDTQLGFRYSGGFKTISGTYPQIKAKGS